MLCFLFGLFVNMQGKRWEIYSFFDVGRKREGKCSFAYLELVVVERYANVHFPLRWAFSFVYSATNEEWKTTTPQLNSATQEYKTAMQ